MRVSQSAEWVGELWPRVRRSLQTGKEAMMQRRVFVRMILLLVLITVSCGTARDASAKSVPGTWTAVVGAQPAAVSHRVAGMAALSAMDVWAVGWSNVSPPSRMVFAQPLIEHWDGVTWTVQSAPTPPDRNTYLFAVTAVSAGDIWAVGAMTLDGAATASVLQPLTLHYDGSAWSQVPAPAVPDASSHALLSGVTAAGPNDVWAAGRDGAAGLVLHWNGTTWARVGVPSASGVVRDSLDWNSISAVSARDVWLVGERRLGQSGKDGTQPVAAHWNGVAWTLENTPLPPGTQNRLVGVAARATDDAWAVGAVGTPPDWPMATPDMHIVPFALHWDGARWAETAVPVPDVHATVVSLTAVVALAPDDAWTSGTFGVKVVQGDTISESAQTFFLHWDGAAWTIVPAPSAATGTSFAFETPVALVAASPADLWCGGQFGGMGEASFLHYGG